MTEEEKEQIMEELCEECATTASIATKLAQDTKQYTKEVPIPNEYQHHWKVFSEEESHRFLPSGKTSRVSEGKFIDNDENGR